MPQALAGEAAPDAARPPLSVPTNSQLWPLELESQDLRLLPGALEAAGALVAGAGAGAALPPPEAVTSTVLAVRSTAATAATSAPPPPLLPSAAPACCGGGAGPASGE